VPYIIHTFTENRWPPDHTRTAVATLDEARAVALDVLGDHGYVEPLNLPADGGTVGPLADGTVIEVRRVKCLCPDDCNCRASWRTTYCGCGAHA